MHEYIITGIVVDTNNKPIKDIMIQAMDSDQKWYEDRNDDILESKWVNHDGTFEILLDKERFNDSLFESAPEFYLVIRNSLGQVIHITEPNKEAISNSKDGHNSIYFEITLPSTEKEIPAAPPDPYLANNERVIAAFQRLGDVSEFRLNDISRILRLLNTSINAWSLYTTDSTWEFTGYDGPQVPKYPWRVPGHSHKLNWEKGSI
jgi:hypothetical protein